MSCLSGKYAIVTGGCRGIGAAIVRRFLAEGAAGVAVFDYDITPAPQEFGADSRVLAIQCDVSEEEQVQAAVEAAQGSFGRVDILVNNAGVTRDAIYHKMTDQQWDQVIKVNLYGTHFCCKYVGPLMRNQGWGKIVNLSSSSANGNVGQANYAASKAAIEGLTKTLARELGAKGITVNAVAPSMIDTDMLRGVPTNILEQYIASIPARRLGSADEVAAAVCFLSSDDSSFVNGIVLPVNGGTFT